MPALGDPLEVFSGSTGMVFKPLIVYLVEYGLKERLPSPKLIHYLLDSTP